MDGGRYLEDGKLTIYRRWGTYYARIRTSASDKYVWRSLKTTNEQTAIHLWAPIAVPNNREPIKVFRQNPNYSQLSLMAMFGFVSGIIVTVRPQLEC